MTDIKTLFESIKTEMTKDGGNSNRSQFALRALDGNLECNHSLFGHPITYFLESYESEPLVQAALPAGAHAFLQYVKRLGHPVH